MGSAFVSNSSTALIGVGEHDAGVASASSTPPSRSDYLGASLLNTAGIVGGAFIPAADAQRGRGLFTATRPCSGLRRGAGRRLRRRRPRHSEQHGRTGSRHRDRPGRRDHGRPRRSGGVTPEAAFHPVRGPAWMLGSRHPYYYDAPMASVVSLRDAVSLSGRFPLLAGVNLEIEGGEIVHLSARTGRERRVSCGRSPGSSRSCQARHTSSGTTCGSTAGPSATSASWATPPPSTPISPPSRT